MDQILTDSITRVGETSKRFKKSQELVQEKLTDLFNIQNIMIQTQHELVQAQMSQLDYQQKLAVDVQKLLIAIQGNEAKLCELTQFGNMDDVKELYNLCKEAQSVEYVERNYMETISSEIDALTRKVIEQQQKEFNSK